MAGKPKPDDPAQSKRFIEAARKIEADEEKTAADEVMGRLAKHAHSRANPRNDESRPEAALSMNGAPRVVEYERALVLSYLSRA
jgi:hypothetical protein